MSSDLPKGWRIGDKTGSGGFGGGTGGAGDYYYAGGLPTGTSLSTEFGNVSTALK